MALYGNFLVDGIYNMCKYRHEKRVFFVFRLEANIMEELREYLLDQDIWEREVDELLGNFNDNVTEDDLQK